MLSQKFIDLFGEITTLNVEVDHVLNPTNKDSAFQEFLTSAAQKVPQFEYGNLDIEKIQQNLSYLSILRKRGSSQLNVQERDLFNKVLEKIENNNKLALHAYRVQTEGVRLYRNAFTAYNRKVYGKPNPRFFAGLLDKRLQGVDQSFLATPTGRELKEIVQKFHGLGYDPLYQPSDDIIDKFFQIIDKAMADMFCYVPDQDYFSATEAFDVVTDILNELSTGYTAEKTTAVSWSVNQNKRIVKVPVQYIGESGGYDYYTFIQKLAHEIGVHVMRGVPFQDSGLPLLSYGIPRYEMIEEGIAKCAEQAIEGRYYENERSIDHYINIGLATFCEKSFCEVYDITYKLKMASITRGVSQGVFEDLQFSNQKLAFQQAVRCFRGTGILPNNKDLMYLVGQNLVWQWIRQYIDDPDFIIEKMFKSGKTNFLDPTHMALVEELKS